MNQKVHLVFFQTKQANLPCYPPLKEEPVSPVLGQILSRVFPRLQLKPNTSDIMHIGIGCWLTCPNHRVAGCSLHFPPRGAQQLWPALPDTRRWSVFRSITLPQSCEASTCGWPQRLHTSPRLSDPLAWRETVLWVLLKNFSVTSEEKRWRLPAQILLRILLFSPWSLMQVSKFSCWMWPPALNPLETFHNSIERGSYHPVKFQGSLFVRSTEIKSKTCIETSERLSYGARTDW